MDPPHCVADTEWATHTEYTGLLRVFSPLYLQVTVKNNKLFLDVCGSLHLSLGRVICEITNKRSLLLEGRICVFLAWGDGIWQAAVKPVDQSPSPSAVAHHNNRKWEEQGEQEGGRDLGGRQLTPLMVGLTERTRFPFQIQGPHWAWLNKTLRSAETGYCQFQDIPMHCESDTWEWTTSLCNMWANVWKGCF